MMFRQITVLLLTTGLLFVAMSATAAEKTYNSFDVPGSKSTAAWDINPSGEIVGVFNDQSNKTHGFLRAGEEYLSIDFPGATATRALGINARGDVVGAYVDSAGRTHGFLADVAPKKQ